MTVLHSGRVAAQQPGALLDVALAEILRFAEFPQPLSDLHESTLRHKETNRQSPDPTAGRFVERQPGLLNPQARQPLLQNCLARWLNCGEGDPHPGVRLGMDHLA